MSEKKINITREGNTSVAELRKKLGTTPLKQEVIRIIIEGLEKEGSVKNSELSSDLSDIIQYGVVEYGVREMLYYTETIPFYERHKGEINALLKGLMEDTGYSIGELFGEKWDKDDPLALGEANQDLLACFGFEETARDIAIKLGMEV